MYITVNHKLKIALMRDRFCKNRLWGKMPFLPRLVRWPLEEWDQPVFAQETIVFVSLFVIFSTLEF